MKKTIDINVYAFGNAAQNADCEHGATVLQNALEHGSFAKQLHFNPVLQAPLRKQQRQALPDVVNLSKKLAHSTLKSVLDHRFFITLGGDHSAAIGSWSG